MTIYSGDIKLNASAVMLDVPEGGGGPTANVVPDGVSNAVFPDISEMDRVNGRVNLRQLHLTVQTDTTDTYLGANIVVADPPEDPNVSITLFATGDAFDTRADAVARMEAYLNVGGSYQGHLFGNHIAGQSTLLMVQRSDSIPAVGDTLVLIKREGFNDEYRQYVRVTKSSLVKTTFTDTRGDFDRNIVTLMLSDVLRVDFFGFDAQREDLSAVGYAERTKIYGTVVANAARYYGVVALVEDASVGDFVVRAESMFTQLVPSAQIETPILDVRTNQTAVALSAAGDATSGTIFISNAEPTVSVFFGTPILPGTFSLSHPFGNFNITDDGKGVVYNFGVATGTIEYENGVITVTGTLTGVGGSFPYSFVPAAAPTMVSQSQGFEITQANRALNYVRTIEPPPKRGTLSVSYRAADRWYVLRDDGTGALRGGDPALGAGSVNATTGTVVVTFGALPDVDTSVIYQWVQPDAEVLNSALTVQDGKAYFALNNDGEPSTERASRGFARNAVTVTYQAAGGTRSATDDGSGNLTGDATGTVDYSAGVVRMSPNQLPLPGAMATLSRAKMATSQGFDLPITYVDDKLRILLPAGEVVPGSVTFSMARPVRFRYQGAPGDFTKARAFTFRDNGVGGMLVSTADAAIVRKPAGTINYTTGEVLINTSMSLTDDEALRVASFQQLHLRFYAGIFGLRDV